ncbi:hypothetical protein SDRG_13530 [Saprolegnia diclina VS20]|uniref:VLIG-type G domain-containing protein n=1 Tax=Saprolegnia diclina (strain VS20) TaxID=1156394 RepID=T0R931_SAPDV|nr:hypothetical protein SDRG_13530 [Saprolegnia diclina VS20]EQC28653.1 hypothetical protein SDRG_13530 [Saprolegnia diclina VS20]|eukprot:XP_008617845.1 hypothetical protein SDRG_13530 [Saprolegnia diclina VS20]
MSKPSVVSPNGTLNGTLNGTDAMGLAETLAEAIEASAHLQDAVRAGHEDEINEVVAHFNQLASALGVSHWIVSDDMLLDSPTLLLRLPVLDKMLTQMSYQVSATDVTPTDDDVVARASGGAALFGYCLGFPGSSKGVEAAILQPPTHCTLEAPTLGRDFRDTWFPSAAAAKDFCAAVRSSRPTRHCGIYDLPLRGTSVVHVAYAIVPMKAFALDVLSTPLTASAVADGARVTDVVTAQNFLFDYGSHVCSGVFHVGGIIWKKVQVSTTTDEATALLQAACPAMGSCDFSINYSSFPYQSCIDVCESTLHDARQTRCDIMTEIKCTGPDALSFAIFEQRLVLDPATWHVIVRPTTRVGVWDLLAAAGFERAASLVRDAWLDLVSKRDLPSDVAAAVRAVYVEVWLHDPTIGTELKHTRVACANAAAVAISHLFDASTADTVESKALVDVALLALRFDIEFHQTFLVDWLCEPRLHAALCRLVAANDLVAMLELGAIYTNVLNAVLVEAGINLDAAVDEALQRAGQLAALRKDAPKVQSAMHTWCVPALDVRDVPIAVKILLDVFSKAAMPDDALLTARVGELIATNISPSGHKELSGIAHKFGCTDDGFQSTLTREHILAMADAMLTALGDGATAESSDEEELPAPVLVKSEPPGPVIQQPMSHLLTVVTKPNKTTDLPGLIWYTLKHRLSLVKELYTTTSGVKRKRADRQVQDASPPGPVVFDGLLSLLDSLTPTARAEVYRLLLDRRYLVPFLVPSTYDELRSEAGALGLVKTRLDKGQASLMRDTSVTRVAVVSEQPTRSSVTKDWIKNVFHVDSVHCLDRTHGNNVTNAAVVAELGWGFVQENTEFTTVMVLHVIGDYMLLAPFITQFADVLVVDTGARPVRLTLPRGTVLHWCHSNDDEDESYLDDKVHIVSVALACPMSTSYERITAHILQEPHDAPKQLVDQLSLPSLVQRDWLMRQRVAGMLAGTDFATLRTKKLRLQRRFAHESELRIALQRETSVPNQAVLRQRIASSEAVHKKVVRVVSQTPLLEYFLYVLKRPDVADREMRIIDLERRLAECGEAITAKAQAECSRAFVALSEVDDEDTRAAYASALATWSNMVTGLEHLWRELSHMFTADPDVYAYLPSLAVQHLLDGFSLELMDGDAGMVNDKWIRAILRCLDEALPANTRVFVLSVMGVQSSGKSTLLNSMFGVRLRTSVARCTRGVNLQLLACDNGGAYDYMLLLDTEGIQSPEYVGVEGTVWRDNRMASVAILPADATIILTKGESTNTINDVLPIVLSAFANSELAAASGGHLATKLYFAFNQIDVTQRSSMVTSLRALLDSLRSSAKQIATVRQSQAATATSFLRDFSTDMTDETTSAVRFLGLTQGQTTPPNDVPLPDFGDRLVRFRDFMHMTAVNDGAWQARTVGELSESLDLVWMCLQSANFELDFASAHERVVYDRLVQAMAMHTQELAKIYSEAFDLVLQTMSADSADDKAPDGDRSSKYELLLAHHVESTVASLDAVVMATLNQNEFAKWATAMEATWHEKKQRQASHSVRLVQSKVQHLFDFDAITKAYKEELQAAIVDHNAKCGPEATLAAFDTIFNAILDKARHARPALATHVPKLVHDVLHGNNIFTPDELRLLTSNDDDASFLQSAWQSARNWVRRDEPSRDAKVADAVRDRVCSDLADVDRYADDVALTCVMSIKRLLSTMQLKPSELKVGLRALHETLTTALQQRQARWDAVNSVVAKFEAFRPSMLCFAQSVCDGQKAAQLLSTTLNEWLGLHLTKAFEEEVVSVVASALKDARWVRTADAMQAALDKDLLQLLRKREMDAVLNHIKLPVEHAAGVMSHLVLAQVQECHLRVAEKLVRDVEDSIVSASAVARDAATKRSKVFVHALRLKLQSRLKCSGTSALIESLPSVAGLLMNCDDQGPSVFALRAHRDGLSVPQSLLARLKALDVHLGPSVLWSSSIAHKIVKAIHNEAYGAVDGIMPRCGKPCPRCFCPCTKALGHVSTTDDALHDTYHQPVGLTGISWNKTNELVESSCATSVVENNVFVFTSGRRPYKEFETIYPGWALPRVTKFLPLREYIFANCQTELVQKYNKLKCSNIPASYTHDIGDLEKHLDRLLR